MPSDLQQLVVIGASAGGIEALKRLVARLPAEFPAPIAVVIHTGAAPVSVLPDIIASSGTLRAVHALHGAPLEAGVIYIAPPDEHLVVERGRARLNHGPKENRTRPAIDPLFRSAATAYGAGAIGVVLTGMLDDGTAGLAAIKRTGGIAIVQDPADAAYPGMPQSAMTYVKDVDYCVHLDDIALLLVKLVSHEPSGRSDAREGPRTESPSGFTCPECHGALWEIDESGTFAYRCRVGHRYAPETLSDEENGAVEAALYAAMRVLRESAAVDRRLAERARDAAKEADMVRYRTSADAKEKKADSLLAMLDDPPGS